MINFKQCVLAAGAAALLVCVGMRVGWQVCYERNEAVLQAVTNVTESTGGTQTVEVVHKYEHTYDVVVEYVPATDTGITYESLDELTDFDRDAALIAQTIYGEGDALSTAEKAAIAWCILNRVDSDNPYFPDTIAEVIQQPSQFLGYASTNPVTDDNFALAKDVLVRWYLEDLCCGAAGRVLPAEYVSFHANKSFTHNVYTADGLPNWDWTLEDPYA